MLVLEDSSVAFSYLLGTYLQVLVKF